MGMARPWSKPQEVGKLPILVRMAARVGSPLLAASRGHLRPSRRKRARARGDQSPGFRLVGQGASINKLQWPVSELRFPTPEGIGMALGDSRRTTRPARPLGIQRLAHTTIATLVDSELSYADPRSDHYRTTS